MVRFFGALLVLGLIGAGEAARFHRRHRSHQGGLQQSTSCQAVGCYGRYNSSLPCQCNGACAQYGNCCDDFVSTCATCEAIGCWKGFDRNLPCQCNSQCSRYNNCCGDFNTLCPTVTTTTPAPIVPVGKEAYWAGVNLSSTLAIQARLKQGAAVLTYRDLWAVINASWVDLPGRCQNGVFDVYSNKCWLPVTDQCGSGQSYIEEGECYNREHSWPKSWWGGVQNAAWNDVFHVFPADGTVNRIRSNFPYDKVDDPVVLTSAGHKRGPCTTAGAPSGSCFEPNDAMKGMLARGHFWVTTRYQGEINNWELEAWKVPVLLRWNAEHPPEAWEVELNDRLEGWQGNRNPFIDFPSLADTLF